jgi:cholesterol transport system auxiliary component
MRRLMLIVVACSLLGACLTTGKRGNAAAMTVYDFGLPAVSTVKAGGMALEVRLPAVFDGLGIDYRLAYRDGGEVREYSRSRWAMPPGQLLQLRLQQALGVVAPGQMRTRCLLRVEFAEFSQVFAAPDNSRAVLQGRAFLLDAERSRIGEFPFLIEVAAATPDASGGVQALRTGVDELAVNLGAWLPGRSTRCGT